MTARRRPWQLRAIEVQLSIGLVHPHVISMST